MNEFRISDEVISVQPITGIEMGTKGVVTSVCDDLYEVIFIGGLLRYLYPNEIELRKQS